MTPTKGRDRGGNEVWQTELNGRPYKVTFQSYNGQPRITGYRSYVVPSTVFSAYPEWRDTCVHVDPFGRLGRRIIATLDRSEGTR